MFTAGKYFYASRYESLEKGRLPVYTPAFGSNSSNNSNNRESKILIPHNNKNFQKVIYLQNQCNEIYKKIGGIGTTSDFLSDISIAKAKISRLRQETKSAWSSCPKELAARLGELSLFDSKLDKLESSYVDVSESMQDEKGGIFLPESVNKKKLITDPLELSAVYNLALHSPESVKQRNLLNSNNLRDNSLLSKKLEKSLALTDKKDWDYEKFNVADSQLYSQMKDVLFIGSTKKTVLEQIKKIDDKLSLLTDEGFVFSPKTGLKVYDVETTGKILALQTAKLRREMLSQPLAIAGVEENLSKSDVLLQPTNAGVPIVFKLDKSFAPSKAEVGDILKDVTYFKPLVNKLFPAGLPLYLVGGYSADNMGELGGGESIPSSPDSGIWLNSYDYKQKYNYMASLESTVANIRGVNDFVPSVVNSKKDRARALSHELGHVVSYKISQNESEHLDDSHSGFLLTPKLSFALGWQGLRLEAKRKLNGNETHPRLNRYLDESDKVNLNRFVDYEMLAEDIRIAINGDNINASSKMTGIYDQSEEGKNGFIKVKNYIKKCLNEEIPPEQALFEVQ